MTQTAVITETTASSEAIGTIVGKIENVLEGESSGSALIAMLSLCVLMQKPDINPEQLQGAIRDTSRFICLLLDSMEAPLVEGELPPTVTLN